MNCVFPEVALFLEFDEFLRLDAAAKEIIPREWENEVWHVVANNGRTGFTFANLDKMVIRRFASNVHSILVVDNEPIAIDSVRVAEQVVQISRHAEKSNSEHLSTKGSFAMSFLTRFYFDREEVRNSLEDAEEVAHSYPVVVNIGGDTCLIELALQNKSLLMSVHNLRNVSDEPRPLCQPLRVQIRSMMSLAVLDSEYILTYEDVDECGNGLCCLPAIPETLTEVLAEGVTCMVSLSDIAVRVEPLKFKESSHLEDVSRCCV